MPKSRRIFEWLIIVILLTWPAVHPVYCQSATTQHFNVNKQGVFIDGYDMVSYFMGEVLKGSKAVTAEYNGIIFWFANKENKTIFLKNPEKFIPAYGGWCAFAMGDSGEKVKIDPETYKIMDGRLYLFYNFYFNNTLIDWNKNEPSLKEEADNNWQRFLQ